MKNMLSVPLVILLFVALIAAATVDVFRNRYIALDPSLLTIAEEGYLDQNGYSVFFDGPVPLEYVAQRDAYRLRAYIDRDYTHWPNMVFEAYSVTGELLAVRGKRTSKCIGIEDMQPGGFFFSLADSPAPAIRYTYALWWRPAECLNEQAQPGTRYTMVFHVLDPAGQILATETIPFTLKANGFQVWFDGL